MSIKNCENCGIKCGFDDEISNLVQNNITFMEDWKRSYKTMDPEELISFLNYWVEEIIELNEQKIKLDELTKGIMLNCLFRELVVDHYPGVLISSATQEELIEKMRNKTNPFEQIRMKIEDMIKNKDFSTIEDEIKNILNTYKERNEIIDEAINNFLLSIINNYQNIKFDVNILGKITEMYLNFIQDKKPDLNTAIFLVRIASYLNDNDEKRIAKLCLLKSKAIYQELGLSKDIEKLERILEKFANVDTLKKIPIKVKPVEKKPKKTAKSKKKTKKG